MQLQYKSVNYNKKMAFEIIFFTVNYSLRKIKFGFVKDKMLLYKLSFSLGFKASADEMSLICNGNRTEWSPIRSVIIQVMTKSVDSLARVRFVYHEYDYRPNWIRRSPVAKLIIKIKIPEKRRIAKLRKKGKLCIKILTKGT